MQKQTSNPAAEPLMADCVSGADRIRPAIRGAVPEIHKCINLVVEV